MVPPTTTTGAAADQQTFLVDFNGLHLTNFSPHMEHRMLVCVVAMVTLLVAKLRFNAAKVPSEAVKLINPAGSPPSLVRNTELYSQRPGNFLNNRTDTPTFM